MESDWVLIWLSFADRYTNITFHRQGGCMLMVLPCRGTEAASSHRNPWHRQLIRESWHPHEGGSVGCRLSQSLLLQKEGLEHDNMLLRPQ